MRYKVVREKVPAVADGIASSEFMRSREEMIRLANRRPETEIERAASLMVVSVSSHNGGVPGRQTLFHVLKYPTAFSLETLRVIEPA